MNRVICESALEGVLFLCGHVAHISRVILTRQAFCTHSKSFMLKFILKFMLKFILEFILEFNLEFILKFMLTVASRQREWPAYIIV